MPFITRLIITCCSSTRSPRTNGRRSASSVRTETLVLHAFAAGELDHLSDRSIDFQPISSRRRFFGEIADPADYLAGPIAVLDDVAKDFPQFVRIHHLGAEEAQRGLRVGDGGADWLLHFMGDRGRQFAQRRHARDVSEFRLRFAVSSLALSQILLGLFALSQIEHEGDALVAGAAESRRADKDGHAAAVVAASTPSRKLCSFPSP